MATTEFIDQLFMAVDEHEAVLVGLWDSDVDRARRCLERHIGNVKARVLDTFFDKGGDRAPDPDPLG